MHALPLALATTLVLGGVAVLPAAAAPATSSSAPAPTAAAQAAGVRQGEGAPMGWSLRGATATSPAPTPTTSSTTSSKTATTQSLDGTTATTTTTATPRALPWYVPGVDTSGYSGTVDWAAYAKAGYAFNFAKATEGTYYKSAAFAQQYTGSYDAGLFHAAYHFAIPSGSTGAAQAEYFVANGGGWSPDGRTLPGALDIEYNPYNGGTCYGKTSTEMISWINDFVNRYRSLTGVYPVVYSTTDWWTQCTGNTTTFNSRITLWVARWAATPGVLFKDMTSWSFWQTASDNTAGVDYNAFHGTRAQLAEWATAPLPTSSMRLGGASRNDTSAEISKRQYAGPFASGKGTVYLARDDIFADAVSGGSLTDGPVLLVRQCGDVASSVAAEIARLDPARVVALGGPPAICDATLQAAAAGRPTSRLAGASRFDTSAAIALERFRQAAVSTVYLASGADVASDAAVGGQLTDGPVLLVPESDTPPASVLQAVASINPARVVALGATNRVSDPMLAKVAGGRSTSRVAGPSRYDTAALIAQRQFPRTASVAYIARGDVYADAISSGSLTDGPILLVPRCGALPSSVLNRLQALNPNSVVPIGSTAAVCDSVVAAARAAAN